MENKSKEIMGYEINLLDYVIVLAKRKIMIILITMSVALITVIYSLMLPEIYKADISILPPGDTSNQSFLMGELTNIMGIGGHSGSLGNPSVITKIIQSRSISNRIIDRFGLMEIYDSEVREDARRILAGSVDVDSDRKSNIITIAVSNEDPQLATDIANTFVELLNTRIQEMAVTKAARKRVFFEEELSKAKEALIESEEAMKTFQEKTGILKVEDQARAVIEGIAVMRAQIAAKEVEIKVMKTYLTPSNPDLQMSQTALKGLKAERRKLEENEGNKPDTLMPIGRMAGVGTNYVRKLRDLGFNEKLFEIMAKQYEMARMDEAKDPAMLQVIDEAVLPEKRYKPQRLRMVMIATAIALFFSVLLAFLMEYISKQQASSQDIERINRLKKYLSFK